jgi:phosphate transport system protein
MHPQSPRETFDRQIQHLLDETLLLGSMVEEATRQSVESLVNRDFELSRRVYTGDREINTKRYEIEYAVITLMATQQPMARDLRLLAAVLEIITELERIGDYAKGIARINIMLGPGKLVKPLIDIPKMAEIGLDMLRRALKAFIDRDANTARVIPKDDDQIDQLYSKVYHDLIEIIVKDPTTVDRANYLLWAGHNLERLGDRVTNICERIVFVQTGEIMEMDQTDDESRIGKAIH